MPQTKNRYKPTYGAMWHIKRAWWIIFYLPFGLTAWIPNFILARRTKKKYLYPLGLAYFVPFTLFIFLRMTQTRSLRLYEAVSSLVLLAWLASWVHGVTLTKHYLSKVKWEAKRRALAQKAAVTNTGDDA